MRCVIVFTPGTLNIQPHFPEFNHKNPALLKFYTINSKGFLILYISNNLQRCKRFHLFPMREQHRQKSLFLNKLLQIYPVVIFD